MPKFQQLNNNYNNNYHSSIGQYSTNYTSTINNPNLKFLKWCGFFFCYYYMFVIFCSLNYPEIQANRYLQSGKGGKLKSLWVRIKYLHSELKHLRLCSWNSYTAHTLELVTWLNEGKFILDISQVLRMKNSRKYLANSTNENHIYVKWLPFCDAPISYRYKLETYGLHGVHRESEGWRRLTISYLHHSDRTHMIFLAILLARTSYLSNYLKWRQIHGGKYIHGRMMDPKFAWIPRSIRGTWKSVFYKFFRYLQLSHKVEAHCYRKSELWGKHYKKNT